MDKNKETLEQIEALLSQVDEKDALLRSLVTRNCEDVFDFISMIKSNQDRGYFFGALHSQYTDIIENQGNFYELCQNYQFGETESSREFYDDLSGYLTDEINR